MIASMHHIPLSVILLTHLTSFTHNFFYRVWLSFARGNESGPVHRAWRKASVLAMTCRVMQILPAECWDLQLCPGVQSSPDDLRQDVRAVMQKARPDWDLAKPGLRENWERDKTLHYSYKAARQ